MTPNVDKSLYPKKKLMKKNFFLTKKQLTTTRPSRLLTQTFITDLKPKPKTRNYEHHEHPRQSHSQRRRSQEH